MKESNKIKKSIIYNSIGSFTYLFCQWIITFIVVWIAGYETAGILSLAMTVSTTFSIVASFNMRNYQASDINNKYSEKTYITSRLITCICALLLTIIYSLYKQFNSYQILCILFYMLFKMNESTIDVMDGSLQKKWKFKIIGLSYICRGIISLATFTIFLYLTKKLLLSIIMMNITTYLFIYFYHVPKYKKICNDKRNTNNKELLNLLLTCLPLVFYGFLFNYTSMYPKIMFEKVYGTKMLGYYSTVATPALIIQVACTFIFNPLVSLFAELYNNNDTKNISKLIIRILSGIIIIGFTCIIVSNFIADIIFKIVFGKEILEYTYVFKGVLINSTLIAIIWFTGTILTITRNYKYIIFGTIISLLTGIIITKYFIINYNMIGINYALLLSYSLQALIYLTCIYIDLRKRGKKQ